MFVQQDSISDRGIGWGCQAESCPVEKVLVGNNLGCQSGEASNVPQWSACSLIGSNYIHLPQILSYL